MSNCSALPPWVVPAILAISAPAPPLGVVTIFLLARERSTMIADGEAQMNFCATPIVVALATSAAAPLDGAVTYLPLILACRVTVPSVLVIGLNFCASPAVVPFAISEPAPLLVAVMSLPFAQDAKV